MAEQVNAVQRGGGGVVGDALKFVERFVRDVSFAANKRSILTPPSEPMLDEGALKALTDILSSPDTRTYVEFGSGGATLLGAANCDFVVSVESDKAYLDLVAEELARRGLAGPAVELLHGDIGPTTHFGFPIFRLRDTAMAGESYFNAPWASLEKRDLKADFVLVDGRYRSACFLASLLNPRSRDALIMLDDFETRSPYQQVLPFVDVVDRPGRSLLARRAAKFDEAACRAALAACRRQVR